MGKNSKSGLIRRLSKCRILAAAVALSVSAVAFAQSNAVGSIFGTSGETGAKVVITNTATGSVRSATVDSNGRFQIPSLPVGNYKVELQKGNRTIQTLESIPVAIGSGSEVTFNDQTLQEVVVSGSKPLIDVSSTDTRSVFTSEELGKISVKRSIEDIALLAPGTVRGDSRYETNRKQPSASFGGAGANENAFYINGYAVTDPIKGLGSSSLPFEAISQYQLFTGGYGAEFGRSTGGVVNIVTKSGTNEWHVNTNVVYPPESLTADAPDIYYPVNGSARDGRLWNQGSARRTESIQYAASVGGPIIRDKMFFYLAGEYEKREVTGPGAFTTYNVAGTVANDGPNGWHDRDIKMPRFLAKLDYTFAEGQLLELTGISDIRKEKRRQYGYYYPLGTAVPTTGADRGLALLTKGSNINGGFDYEDGGELYIAKYTGTISDNLIFTALYGASKQDHETIPFGYDPSVVSVRDFRAGTPITFGANTTLNEPHAYDKTTGYRFDLEYILGRHDLRVGYDVQNLEIKDGQITPGPGYVWNYDTVGAANANNPIPGAGGARGPGGNGDYVTKSAFATGGTFTTDQFAYFIEDRWQLTTNILLSVGLRNENFRNYNSDKVVFLDQTDQWAPRLGITWDVFGDARLRTFANVGRYHLAIPLNVALRQVGGSLNTDEYFSFTGISPTTGIPQGLVALGAGPYAPNNEYGQARDPLQAAAQGLKAYFQDEFVLGAEAQVWGGLKAGARLTYRALKSQIDDNCDGRPAYNWAVANGKGNGRDLVDLVGGSSGRNGLDDLAEEYWLQLSQCRIINPGEANTIRFEDPVTGAPVLANIGAELWGLPKLKREYRGVDLFLEHPFRNKWYGKIDYTLSKSQGNAEGMLYSDSGQQDVAVTANWDHPELMVGADGPLPNDRRHQIKAFGFFQFTPEWRVSATLNAASGRPRAPAGFYTGPSTLPVTLIPGSGATNDSIFNDFVAYPGRYYHWADGQLAARGAAGRLPWTTVLDLGASYAPNRFDNNLSLGFDVFNVLNSQDVQSIVEDAEAGPFGVPYHSYGKTLSFNAARQVRFSVRYDWRPQ